MYWLLFYDYSPDYLERRTPFRPEHFSWCAPFRERGELLMAGAYADPADGAALVFKCDTPDTIQRFVDGDPYRREGLIDGYRIRGWTVVIGDDERAKPASDVQR